jgi:hypothetical protein
MGVYGGDHKIELRKEIPGNIQRAILSDIRLHTTKEAEVLEGLVDSVDLLDLAAEVIG